MKKKFNAVEYQRKIREELSKQYIKDKELVLKELKKYSNLKTVETKKQRSHALYVRR